MYTSVDKILEKISAEELINYTNDENRTPSNIDLNNDADLIVDRVNKIINKADEWINSFLMGKYKLPVNPVPVRIEEISTDETIYRLVERRHYKNMPEDVTIKHNDNFKYMMEIQKGNINPGLLTAGDKDKSDVMIRTNKSSKNKTFTDDFMKDF